MSTVRAQNYGDGTGSVPASALLKGTAKAYGNQVADSGAAGETYNLSSITDGGVGINTYAFTSSFVNTAYGSGGGSYAGATATNERPRSPSISPGAATGATTITIRNDTAAASSVPMNSYFYGDLA